MFLFNEIAYDVINVLHINMDFQLKVVNHAIVMRVVPKDFNVMHQVNVHVMIMLKEDVAIDAKRINTIVIKVVLIALIAIIWFEMPQMIIEKN